MPEEASSPSRFDKAVVRAVDGVRTFFNVETDAGRKRRQQRTVAKELAPTHQALISVRDWETWFQNLDPNALDRRQIMNEFDERLGDGNPKRAEKARQAFLQYCQNPPIEAVDKVAALDATGLIRADMYPLLDWNRARQHIADIRDSTRDSASQVIWASGVARRAADNSGRSDQSTRNLRGTADIADAITALMRIRTAIEFGVRGGPDSLGLSPRDIAAWLVRTPEGESVVGYLREIRAEGHNLERPDHTAWDGLDAGVASVFRTAAFPDSLERGDTGQRQRANMVR